MTTCNPVVVKRYLNNNFTVAITNSRIAIKHRNWTIREVVQYYKMLGMDDSFCKRVEKSLTQLQERNML